jgi:dTMP kinase
MKKGCFITLEGGDGSGKSSQIDALQSRLVAVGKSVVTTREPGGSKGAEEIRQLLLTGEPNRWLPMTEVLLLFAARLDHVERLIKPELNQGNWVISDRFADSSMAYQGYGHDLGEDAVMQVQKSALGDFVPDMTIILDLPVELGLKRAGVRIEDNSCSEDRFERMGLKFHQKLREGYLAIARHNPERCKIIDASGSVDEVAALIWAAVLIKLNIDTHN